MAHGFSGTMDWIVPDFAARFADGGLAALIFDYRYLGDSGGEPREYPVRHFDMYHGAVREQVAADQLAFLVRHLLGNRL